MAGSVGDGEFGFQIAPMLDILFVLLLFFMVSAGAQKHEASLVTQLPGGQPGKDVPVRIGIDEAGQVDISGAPIDAAQPVVVTPTRSTTQQRVVDVLNACAAAGIKNLAFGSTD
jgi:biopolymer transport protein ExbD